MEFLKWLGWLAASIAVSTVIVGGLYLVNQRYERWRWRRSGY